MEMLDFIEKYAEDIGDNTRILGLIKHLKAYHAESVCDGEVDDNYRNGFIEYLKNAKRSCKTGVFIEQRYQESMVKYFDDAVKLASDKGVDLISSAKPVFEESPINPATIAAEQEQLMKKQSETSKSISAMELLSRGVDNIPCIVEPILHKIGLACIAGSSDTGKSSLLRYLCMCVVSGKSDFLGFAIHAEHKRAIYVSTEDDETAISYLLRKQNRDLLNEPSELEGLRFIFDTENLLQTLDKTLTKQPADIICIDAFTDLYGGRMNESNQVRGFLNDYSQLAQKHKCLVLFLHHCGKRTEELEPSKHNLLGSQAFEAKMRLVMELRSDVLDDNLKHLCIVKGNYLPADAKKESCQLRFTDNMTFINTGERVPLGSLAKAVTDNAEKEKYERAIQLQSQGRTLEEIASVIGYRNRGGVSKLLKRGAEKYDVSEMFPQETQETQEGNINIIPLFPSSYNVDN